VTASIDAPSRLELDLAFRLAVDITTLMPRAATERMTSSIALVAAGIEARGRLVEQAGDVAARSRSPE